MSVADLQYLDFPLIFDLILIENEYREAEEDPIAAESKTAMLQDAFAHVEENYKNGFISEEDYAAFMAEWRESCASI